MLARCLFLACAMMAPARAAPPAMVPDPLFEALRQCAPASYDAAVLCLDQAVPAGDRAALAQPDGLVRFFLGIWIINNWGLANGGPLHAALRARGLTEPADMTEALLDGLVARDQHRVAKPSQREVRP